MPRVLMLSTDLQRGGLPLRLQRLALRLRRTEFEPIVGCLAPPGPISEELAREGVATFSCDARGALDASCIGRLARIVRHHAPDIVHAALFHANLAARLVGRAGHDRPIITSTVTIEIERPWHRWLEAATSGLSDVHVANSNAVAAHLVDDLCFSPSRVVVIPNGIDLGDIAGVTAMTRRELGVEDDAFLVVWAGRMDPVKQLETFIEVIGRLSNSRKTAAILLGDGPARLGLEQLVAARGLQHVVRIFGWTPNVAAVFKAADCLLFPSRTEGSPNTVIEAMASGCPVVASDIAPCRELIHSGVSGLLCPVGDADAFAAALRRIADESGLAARLRRAAMEAVHARHDMAHVVAQWTRLYGSLLVR